MILNIFLNLIKGKKKIILYKTIKIRIKFKALYNM